MSSSNSGKLLHKITKLTFESARSVANTYVRMPKKQSYISTVYGKNFAVFADLLATLKC